MCVSHPNRTPLSVAALSHRDQVSFRLRLFPLSMLMLFLLLLLLPAVTLYYPHFLPLVISNCATVCNMCASAVLLLHNGHVVNCVRFDSTTSLLADDGNYTRTPSCYCFAVCFSLRCVGLFVSSLRQIMQRWCDARYECMLVGKYSFTR